MSKEVRIFDINTDLVICKYCGKTMRNDTFDRHFDRCFDIEYLLFVARQKGEEFTREDLENCTDKVIERLMSKYQPKKLDINEVFTRL